MYDARRVARVMGFKLLILSGSFAALASALPAPAQASLAEASWAGMKLLHLILGTAGAGASLFFLPQFNGRSLAATVVCGVLCAVVGTPLVVWLATAALNKYFAPGSILPGSAENALAVSMGVAGVYIIPAIQNAATAFRADPWGMVARFFGRTPPPPPPGGQP